MEVKRQHFKLLVEVDVYDGDGEETSEAFLEQYVKDLLDAGEMIKTRKVEAYMKKTDKDLALDNVGDGHILPDSDKSPAV